ncbi:MAG: deoxynucleoside kinase [Mycoplasma sp.]|nr:deoxynucleoside kinase [Mycoplasma sp.]
MKKANLIIVGGTVAAGKSTLVDKLSKHLGWNAVAELRENDEVQDIVLKKMYEGKRLHMLTIQCFFINNRLKQYEENFNGKVMSILDRGIWEDLIFAKLWFKDDIKSHEFYIQFWNGYVEKIIKEFGLPKLYVYLLVDWDTFKTRIFNRARKSEIQNFHKNSNFFKELLKEYNTNFINILKKWNIDYIVLDTKKISKEETLNQTLKLLKEKNLV